MIRCTTVVLTKATVNGFPLCLLVHPPNKAQNSVKAGHRVNNMPLRPITKLRTRIFSTVAALSCLCISGWVQAQATSPAEQLQQARTFEAAADYANAAEAYRQYLLIPGPKSAERRHARLKLPVLQEAVKHGSDPSLQLYLTAMDQRADGNIDQADETLRGLIESYAGWSLADDALYLRAYIALMDYYDYQRANDLLQTLRNDYPQSRYVDTALFAEAISHEQLGNSTQAIEKMTELRDRHTGLSVGGISWARDAYTSRLWFDRSTKRIDYLKERAETATQLISMSEYGSDGYQWMAELLVDQQTMTLLLNESDAVNDVTIKGAPAVDVRAFSGIVMGQPDSWARITIDSQSVRGMISVFGERHELIPATTGGSLSDFHTLLLGDIDGNVDDELDRALIPPKSEDSLNNYLRSVRAAGTQLAPGTVSQVALIGVVIDSQYNDYHSGQGMSEALSILNTTDGIFREQLGVALKVDTVVVIDSRDNDPMNLGSVSMETMMRNFKDYRLGSNDLGSDIGLATLFSGNKNNDAALGLAWIGSACRTDGFDVSVVTPYKNPSLLSTHEIGHTMGAQHDSDTACSSQNSHIMWPFLSSASGRSFSSCSQQSIATTMANNNCHIDAMDLSLTLDSINTGSLKVVVTNEDTQRAIPDAVVSLTGPGIGNSSIPANCWQQGKDTVECGTGTLSPFESSELSFNFPDALSDTAQIVATVEGNGFLDVMTDNNGFKTDVYGNQSSYSGSLNSDAVSPSTLASRGSRSSSGSEGAIASLSLIHI